MRDLFSVQGKTAVVTGGSSGIGEMIARGLVEAGVKVYISSRKADVCETVAAELNGLGSAGECIALPADLSTEAECNTLAAELARRESGLHILVNNAGANWGAPFEEFPDSAWDKVLALNVKAIFHLTRACTPLLQKVAEPGDPARVINVGSIDGLQVPALETYAYSASKAAVHHMTRVLARKLAPGVTVNAIAPGPFHSRMMRATLEAYGEGLRASVPVRRLGEPGDMAGTVLYLSSRAGSYVNAVVLPVDGGISGTR